MRRVLSRFTRESRVEQSAGKSKSRIIEHLLYTVVACTCTPTSPQLLVRGRRSHGHVLVIDEADRPPEPVVAIFRQLCMVGQGGPALSESGCAAALRARVTMLERKPSLPFLDSMSSCMGILACPSVLQYCDLACFPLPLDSLQDPQNILLARQSGPGPCDYMFVCHYQCKQENPRRVV